MTKHNCTVHTCFTIRNWNKVWRWSAKAGEPKGIASWIWRRVLARASTVEAAEAARLREEAVIELSTRKGTVCSNASASGEPRYFSSLHSFILTITLTSPRLPCLDPPNSEQKLKQNKTQEQDTDWPIRLFSCYSIYSEMHREIKIQKYANSPSLTTNVPKDWRYMPKISIFRANLLKISKARATTSDLWNA